MWFDRSISSRVEAQEITRSGTRPSPKWTRVALINAQAGAAAFGLYSRVRPCRDRRCVRLTRFRTRALLLLHVALWYGRPISVNRTRLSAAPVPPAAPTPRAPTPQATSEATVACTFSPVLKPPSVHRLHLKSQQSVFSLPFYRPSGQQTIRVFLHGDVTPPGACMEASKPTRYRWGITPILGIVSPPLLPFRVGVPN